MVVGGLFIAICVVLFVLAFITKRRFGILGLALAAGSLLSTQWTGELVRMIEQADTQFASLPVAGLVAAGLVVAPALLLLFSGPSYKGMLGRVIGSIAFTAFAALLIIEPLSSVFALSDIGAFILNIDKTYGVYVVTVGVIASVLDLLFVHMGGGHHASHKKHH